ncbi:MAG: hypothetical protein CSA72_10410 [Rhodobacterales bacterium]|nr:MAG: hypothetical protein CSA72_10410 [Rhodobacterales bacterium]
MTAHRPICLKESGAAKMLDLPVSEFLRLVGVGALPPPVMVGPHQRWRLSDLEAIVNGTAALPDDGFEI